MTLKENKKKTDEIENSNISINYELTYHVQNSTEINEER